MGSSWANFTHTRESEEKDCGSHMQEGNPLTTSKHSRFFFWGGHSASSKATHLSSENFKRERENYQVGDRVYWVLLWVNFFLKVCWEWTEFTPLTGTLNLKFQSFFPWSSVKYVSLDCLLSEFRSTLRSQQQLTVSFVDHFFHSVSSDSALVVEPRHDQRNFSWNLFCSDSGLLFQERTRPCISHKLACFPQN